jgi:hypothetical protein
VRPSQDCLQASHYRNPASSVFEQLTCRRMQMHSNGVTDGLECVRVSRGAPTLEASSPLVPGASPSKA